MKIWIVGLLSIVLLLNNAFLLYTNKKIKAEASSTLKEREDFWKNRVQVINQLAKVELKFEGVKINPNASVTSAQNERKKFSDLLGGSSKLIFAIPEAVCNVCHEGVFKHFNTLASDIGSKNLLILVPKDRLRETMAEFDNSHLNANILGVSSDDMQLNVGKGYVPFFFILDANMACQNLFVPNANNPEMTSYYFETIRARFFQ